MSKALNLLAESGLPIVYQIDPSEALEPDGIEGSAVAVRTAVRSLTVMQKEAVVARSGTGVAWRLASDEGPYLQGHDFAPAPLAYLATGFATDLLVSIERSLTSAGVATPPVVILDNRFTMEGSLPRGTMVGGALPPEITVHVNGADRSATTGAVLSGVMASAIAGLAHVPLTSLFSLTSHGDRVPVGRVAPLDEPPPSAHLRPARFPTPMSTPPEPLVIKAWDVGEHPADAGSSLRSEQRRELHLRAEAHRLADGLAAIAVAVNRPSGSTFRFLSDEPAGHGGASRAPDSLTYLSAGIGFCFMTQIGRYAKILRRDLGDYHIIQDTGFSYGDPSAEPPVGGMAAAPRTHVYLAPDQHEFAAHALDMSEQTCFVHALCRSELRPRVTVLPPE